MSEYFVYIIRCADDTLYTGVSTDVKRRYREHQEGRGAKYTRAHRASELVYQKKIGTRGEAQKRETEIKSMTRDGKLALIAKNTKKKKR